MINKKSVKIFKLIVILFIFLIIIGINFVSAATLYWVGVSNGNWSDASNWASTSEGIGGIR